MEFVFEMIAALAESLAEKWIRFVQNKNPNYNKRIITVITITISLLIVILVIGILLGILFLIEWFFPNLLDVVDFQ